MEKRLGAAGAAKVAKKQPSHATVPLPACAPAAVTDAVQRCPLRPTARTSAHKKSGEPTFADPPLVLCAPLADVRYEPESESSSSALMKGPAIASTSSIDSGSS